MQIAFGAERFNLRLLRELRFNRLNRLLGSQRHAREKIIRQRHARDDLHVNKTFVHQQLTNGVVILRPM